MQSLRAVGLLVALVGAALVVEARPAPSAKRLSVLDYYFLLPIFGNSAGSEAELKSQKQMALRPQDKPVIDLRHDYLSAQPDSSPRVQIAVFRGGGDFVAYSAPDYHSDYNWFALYQLRGGKLRDVTKQMMPVPARTNSFLYQLPRLGTTIHVFSFDFRKQTRKPAFDLKWQQGRFVKASLKRAKR